MEGKHLQDLVTDFEENASDQFVIPVSHAQSVPVTVKTKTLWFNDARSRAKHQRHTDDIFSHAVLRLRRYPENIISNIRSSLRLKRLRQNMLVQALIGLVILAGFGSIIPAEHSISSLEQSLLVEVKSGYTEMELAKSDAKNQKFDRAIEHFQKANTLFNQAQSSLQRTGQASTVLPFLVNDAGYTTAQSLLAIADHTSKAGIAGASLGKLFTASLHTEPATSNSDDPFVKVNAVLADILAHSSQMMDLSTTVDAELSEAMRLLQNYAASPVANVDLEQARAAAWNTIPKLSSQSKSTRATIANLGSLLGQDRNRRYILLFLNNTELRPGGGFIGSFATFLVKKGQVEDFTVQTNIYKLDDAFNQTAHIDPPYPLSQLNQNWTMHDANWDADFHASAEKVSWFYKTEGGSDVDGVLSIDTTFLEQLLDKTGPIEVPNQDMTLTADNAVSLLQYKSEKEYLTNPDARALNEPKKAIADAFPFLLSKTFGLAKSDAGSLQSVFDSAVREKHLMFAPLFPEAIPVAAGAHLDSSLPLEDDFLMVNNGNLGGMKSSLHINEHVDVTIQPTEHGTLLHSVTITRTHTGSYTWPDGDNHNYVRLVVPKNAVYLQSSSDGTEKGAVESQAYIEQFDRYQTFGHWLTTPVGSTKSAQFQYETPIQTSLFTHLQLVFHYLKQPGWTGDDLVVQFNNGTHTSFNIPQNSYHLLAREDLLWQVPIN